MAPTMLKQTNGGTPPALSVSTWIIAAFYILSGVTQPLIMTLAKRAGITNPEAQVYMVFYYLGAATVVAYHVHRHNQWPSSTTNTLKICLIALFDLGAQAMNYTASTLAGPTLFAIIYSSVTVWTAVFSRVFLRRRMNPRQWLGVFIVFGGLCVTGISSVELGEKVMRGSLLVTIGSMMHAMTYIMSEAVMTYCDGVTVESNCAIQGMTACVSLLLWQFFFTRPRWNELIEEPVEHSSYEHSWTAVLSVLLAFGVASVVHSVCYFYTLARFPGGATSAGIMKGLQAVLVFAATSVAYCGHIGGEEMCFSQLKLASLVVVVGGVFVFGKATEEERQREWHGYETIGTLSAAQGDEKQSCLGASSPRSVGDLGMLA